MRVVFAYIAACKVIGNRVNPSAVEMETAHDLPLSGNAVRSICNRMMQDTAAMAANRTNLDRVGAERRVRCSPATLRAHFFAVHVSSRPFLCSAQERSRWLSTSPIIGFRFQNSY